jgi:outer membrane protein insertion porin family
METMKKHRHILIIVVAFLMLMAVFFSGTWAGPVEQIDISKSRNKISDVLIEINAPVEGLGDGRGKVRGGLSELAKNLIRIKKDDDFSSAKLEESIDALKQSNRFENIHADSVEKNGRLVLLFRLTPFALIRDIRIHKAFPLFEKDVLNAMTLSPGEVCSDAALSEQEKGISAYLKNQGYPAPQVHLLADKNGKDGQWIIHVYLDKKTPLVLGSLVFEGNTAISTFRLKSLMKIRPSIFRLYIPKRFVEKILKKDVETLLAYYRKKDFADCRISTRVESMPGHRIRAVVVIAEGRRYVVDFEGNKSLGTRKLKKQALRFNQGNQNDAALKKIAAAIREIYREAGFADARVKFEDAPASGGKPNQRHIHFMIDEGQRLSVNDLRIKGNAAFRTQNIKKEMLTQRKGVFRKGYFLSRVLEEDVDSIKALYRKNGFINTEVRQEVLMDQGRKGVSVNLTIDEKAQTLVSEIDIKGLRAVSGEAAYKAMGLKKGKPFREYMLKSDENTLSAMISEAGYPFVVVTGSVDISKDQKSARVAYEIVQGPLVKMGQIFFSGNFRTKNDLLSDAIGLSPGDPFSSRKMLKGQKSLRDMDIFDSVRFNPIGLKEKWDQVDLLVDLEEKKPYFAEFSVGYETQKGFFLQSKAGDRNLFGSNKDAGLGFDVSQTGYRVESEILEPRLLGSHISMNTSLYTEKEKLFNQDFGTAVFGANVGFSHKPIKHITAGLNLRFEQRDQFGESSISSEDNDLFKPRPLLALTPSLSFDTRDSFIYPKKGILTSISADISKGVVKSLDNFVKYRLESRAYVTPANRLTFAWAGRVGHIAPYGNTNAVADDQLFFLGGISDVRGVDENMLFFDEAGKPLGGRTFIFSSVEARIDLGLGFEIPLFFDTGKLSKTAGPGVSGQFRSAVGTGLRYLTPIGPIGFLYGKNLDPQKGEPSGRVHFSIGYTF